MRVRNAVTCGVRQLSTQLACDSCPDLRTRCPVADPMTNKEMHMLWLGAAIGGMLGPPVLALMQWLVLP